MIKMDTMTISQVSDCRWSIDNHCCLSAERFPTVGYVDIATHSNGADEIELDSR